MRRHGLQEMKPRDNCLQLVFPVIVRNRIAPGKPGVHLFAGMRVIYWNNFARIQRRG
jgi:hypothetical protein